ncbi:M28 family peptidase [Massilia sp. YIM B04103]|uniref:M28 family peptidase n=1 Tax=Massilia sp. YIM B04103 TaxID=2963106 RepID=UPI00210E02C2|nr:M28 family peptidase [Massilia sp. YIM B04103]
MRIRPTLLVLLGTTLAAPTLPAADLAHAQPTFGTASENSLLAHIQILASDDFEGRAPGTPGEAKTVAYIEQQFRRLGLKPGNPDGSYVQAVPMRGQHATPRFSYQEGGERPVQLRFPDDFVAYASGLEDQLTLRDSELVFVGYGVVAPEYGWDDYKGADLRGKTLLMLINDPALPDPRDPSRLDPAMFRGEAMTYYGRWNYKYESAAQQGAAAALIVHETKPAAYPYEVVRNGALAERFSLLDDGAADGPPVPGWIHLDKAKELVAAAGYDFAALKQAALSKDFRPISLKAQASFDVSSQSRNLSSQNVVGLIEGSDPLLKHDYIIYSAHWDHFGIDERLPGPRSRQIYHGALDNASGVGALLELAKAYQALPQRPKRSILFLATTAEESGLLGAKYYGNYPLYPLARTVANINIDGINAWGRTAQIENVTSGHSTLDEVLARHALAQGRSMAPDARPELGSFYRADQLEFARQGVPVLYTKSRSGYIGKPDNYARDVVDYYVAHDYHKVSDEVRDNWDFSGGLEDIELLFRVGHELAQGGARPQWYPTSEFRTLRATLRAKP